MTAPKFSTDRVQEAVNKITEVIRTRWPLYGVMAEDKQLMIDIVKAAGVHEVASMLSAKEVQLRERYDSLLSALTLREEEMEALLREERVKGFFNAVELLRTFKDERSSLRIPALHMADWLEEQAQALREKEGENG